MIVFEKEYQVELKDPLFTRKSFIVLKWTLVWLMALFAIFSPLPSTIIAEETGESPPQYPPGQEIIEERGEYKKIFQNPNTGATTIYASTQPLHYYDQTTKRWENIDAALDDQTNERDEDNTPFGYQCLKNNSQIFVSRHGAGWIRLRSGDSRLEFRLAGGSQRPFNRTGKPSLTANELLPGCDLNLKVIPAGVKEEVIIKSRNAPREFEYRIRVRNLEISQTEEGILFTNPQGETVYLMPKFFMYDRKKDTVCEDIQTTLIKQGAEYRLRVIPSQSWLDDPRREYPVTLDPTTITVNGQSSDLSGYNCTLVYYLPSNDLVDGSKAYPTPMPKNYTLCMNHFDDVFLDKQHLYGLPYKKTRVTFTATSGGGSQFTDYTPASFAVYNWDINAGGNTTEWRGDRIYYHTFGYKSSSKSGEFYIEKGKAVRIELKSAQFRWWSSTPWTAPCSFSLTIQNETMSPPAPTIQPLPPETPTVLVMPLFYGSVTLRWNPAQDDWNQKAWDQLPWKAIKDANLIPGTIKDGKIVRYLVQYDTSSSFTNPTTLTLTGSQITTDGHGLVYVTIPFISVLPLPSSTYYFRVCAGDDNDNPLNMVSWDEIENPSGPRWSAVTMTTLVAPQIAGGPGLPTITGITPNNPEFQGGPREYCNSSTPTITWNQTNPARIWAVNEATLAKYQTTINTPGVSGKSVPLPDGDYVFYVQTTNSAGNSPWSAGKRVTIDTKTPVISAITEGQSGDDVTLKFTGSEPVKAAVYWNLKDSPEGLNPPFDNYLVYDGASSLSIPGVFQNAGNTYYYRLVFYDKALNAYSTPTVQLGGGPGNNIANTGAHFGLDSAWTYQTIDLGRAGTAKVNLNNGNLVVAATDFAIPGRGLPLELSRYYNSLIDDNGMLGMGWRSSFEMYLELTGQNVAICDADGSKHTFAFVSDTQFNRPPGDFRKIIRNSGDGTYTVTETNGLKYYFAAPQNSKARLSRMVDRFGNNQIINYDSNGYLTSVAEPSGRITALFHYDYYDPVSGRNLLSRIDFTPVDLGAPSSRYMKYFYRNGRLAEVRYPSDTTPEIAVDYSYDSVVQVLNSSRVCLKDSNNNIQDGSIKNETTFAYKCSKRSLGAISTWFNSIYGSGSPVKRRINYYFDYDGALTTFTDPRGNSWKYTHYGSGVNNGQCQSVEAPVCYTPSGITAVKPATVYYTYDGDCHVKTVKQQKNVYDPVNGVNRLRDVVTTYTYNSNADFNLNTGNLESVIADDGDPVLGCKRLTTRFTYEPNQNGVLNDLKTITDPTGNITTYNNTYSNGKLASITIIPPATDPPDPYTITHTFNQYGERTDKDVKMNGASLYHFGYGYQGGLLTSLSNYYGSATYDYTLYGERRGSLDANKVKTQSSIYYLTGNQTVVQAPWEDLSKKTGKEFDNYTIPQGQSRLGFTYDVNGNKTSETDAQSNITHYFYDELNRLIRVQSPYVFGLEQYNSYNLYDENGNLVETLDYDSKYTTYQFDAVGRRTQIKDADGKVLEEVEYDEANRVKRKYDAAKLKFTDYFYDSLDNLLCVKYYDKNSALVGTVKYFKIDGSNNVISYDANGNLLAKSAPISSVGETGTVVTDYRYDALNRPVAINTSCPSDAKYNQSVGYTYEAGQLKTMTVTVAGGSPQVYTYSYDQAQRLDSIINSSGQKFKFEYYAGGQRKFKYIYNQSGDVAPFMTVGYRYDAAYLLKNLNYGWGGSRLNQGYVYNTLDKITDNLIDYNLSAPEVAAELVRGLGPEHDGIDYPDLTSVQQFYQNNSFTNKYTYDKLGRMTSSTVYGINPQLVPGIMNNSDHRPKVQFSKQIVRNTVIDPNGNPKTKQIESLFDTTTNVTTETNYYDKINKLTSKDVVKQSSPIQIPRINYTYDDFGNLLGESGQEKTPPTYTYGPDQQMIRSFSESFHFSGSKYENCQWVNVPDCYTLSDKSFTYELGGKLLKIKSINHNDSNIYDRIDDNFIDYFYYSHDGAVAERHDDIGMTKYFTRLGGELLACDNNGQRYFYIQNIRGDVMALVGADGVVRSVRDYDASGQMLSKAPGHIDRDPFGFTGGLDVGNGLWKLGARIYDSGKGSFIQQDRYMGDPSDPLSLNRYVYCGLDPVNFVDPTGFMGQAVADFGSQVMNGAPFPVLRAIGMGIVGVGMAIILVETIPDFVSDMMRSSSVGDLWKDKMNNPGDWELVKERTEAGKQKGTTSYERKYVNKVTGEVVYEHEIKNDSNQKSTHGPHPRGYQKGDDGGSDGGSE